MDCRQTRIFTGNALNDANEVPCRIVRGEQAEGGSAAGRKAVHHAFERLVRVAVDGDADALAGPDMFDLGFLEVRHDPHIVDRNDVEQGGARRDEPADADLAVADDAADGRTHHGAVEIDLGEIACGPCLRDGGNGGFALGGENGDALLLCLHRCRRGRHARLGSRPRSVAFIDLGLAHGAAANKLAAAVGGLGRKLQLGHGRALLGFGLPNEGMLKLGFGIDIGEASLSGFDIGRRLREPCAVVPIVDPEQDVTRPDGSGCPQPPPR